MKEQTYGRNRSSHIKHLIVLPEYLPFPVSFLVWLISLGSLSSVPGFVVCALSWLMMSQRDASERQTEFGGGATKAIDF